MVYNEENQKYKSGLTGVPFKVKTLAGDKNGSSKAGHRLKSADFYLVPVFRNPPDLGRVGRALIEMALSEPDDK